MGERPVSILKLAASALAALVATFGLCLATRGGSRPQERPRSSFEQRVPYVPSPPDIVEKMLELAEVTSHDRVYDLGSGDGRIVIIAAQKFGARAVGIELDEKLSEEASAQIAELGLQDRAKIIHGDIFNSDFSLATVVTLYLLTWTNERLRPLLERQLRPGARIVSHDYHVPGWKPEKEVKLMSKNGVPHTLFLYVRP
jgi:SAM-dependent methyltransferase